jgi:sec-independent protein translocase protein TatA
MFGSLGMPELLIIGVVCLLIFGPRQLPKLGKSLGETIKEFRGVGKEIQRGLEDDEKDAA